MIERYFTIKNFRSIGTDEVQHFDLNYLTNNADSYGGLVTLIGENNSGKSNVLGALKVFGSRSFSKNDIPFHNLVNGVEPEICLFIKDHYTKSKAKVKLQGNKYLIDFEENDKKNEKEEIKNLSSPAQSLLDFLKSDDFRDKSNANHRVRDAYTAIAPLLDKIVKKEFLSRNEFEILNSRLRHQYLILTIREKFDISIVDIFMNDIKNILTLNSEDESDNLLLKAIDYKFKVKAIPKVIEYLDSNKIKRADTMSPVSSGKIQNPLFFLKIYDLLENESYEELKNAYANFNESGMQRVSILTNYSRRINKALQRLSDQFNDIYSFNGTNKYTFSLKLESNYIYFMITENEEDVFLDSQSTGFKWFFDFFFNVFADKKIESGDIVILDEPATNLHVSGQIELRKQIKDFGIKSGITFVMCTHSPFLIDPDFLDEVRIIRKEGLETRIINKFNYEEKDLDVMMPIKTALTVSRHILMNPDDTLIFVEGVTDYNYLVMTKLILGFENITFMPIQGIKRASLFKDLLKVTKSPILLVDSDGAGKYAYEKFKNTKGFEIIRLEDINEKFVEIEDLFSEEDSHNFSIKDKNYKFTSALKNSVINKRIELGKFTLDNFNILLERLSQ